MQRGKHLWHLKEEPISKHATDHRKKGAECLFLRYAGRAVLLLI